MPASTNIRYLGGLDDLRGAAALMILFYHGQQLIGHPLHYGTPFTPTHWETATNPLHALLLEGHTAVGLFLFLSGFIFSFGATGRAVRFTAFMRNRALRIYPLIIALIAVGSAIYRGSVTLIPFLQTALLFTDYPGGLDFGPITPMLWTIGVEWKCYLLFPFLHGTTERVGLRYLIGICLFMVLARAAYAYLSSDFAALGPYWTLLGRLDQFCIGMIFGRLYAAGRLSWLKPLLPVSLALVLFALTAYNWAGGWPAPHPWKVLWPTAEALLWGAVASGYVQLADSTTRAWRPLRWVGLCGYSVYLLHFPVIAWFVAKGATVRFVEDWSLCALLNTSLIIVPVTISIAALTFLLIERPALELRRKYALEAAAQPELDATS